MGSLIEELGRRETSARAEVIGLRSRIEELSEELARAEEQAGEAFHDLDSTGPAYDHPDPRGPNQIQRMVPARRVLMG